MWVLILYIVLSMMILICIQTFISQNHDFLISFFSWGFLNLLLHPFFQSFISNFVFFCYFSFKFVKWNKHFNFFMVKNVFVLQNFFFRKLFNIILHHFLGFFNLEIGTSYFCTFCYFFFFLLYRFEIAIFYFSWKIFFNF